MDDTPGEEPQLTQLVPVIGIDREKCVNCHACISACPVKFCNDGSGDFVTLDSNMCIGCGTCLSVCTHDARYHIDDFQAFMDDVAKGVKMVAITAPSAAANFPGHYLNLNGWLQGLGVEAVFDVSFGAELAVKSCVEYMQEAHPPTLIASACPVIVTFLKIYLPELLPYLVPIDSPMGHCVKMIRMFYPEYAQHRVAVLSPCIAKKREFLATGLGDYNVGLNSVAKYLDASGQSLSDYPAVDFRNEPPERAVLISSPGGLRRNLARWLPDFAEKTREIEGTATLYEYLKDLAEVVRTGRAPRFVDCLSCEMGCNGGPLTLAKDFPLDEVEYWIEQRNKEMQALHKAQSTDDKAEDIERILSIYWQPGLYQREYINLSSNNTMQRPTETEREAIYRRMHKYSQSDIYNCTACGYMACEDMATAIFNGKNKPENCHFYLSKEASLSHERILQRENRFRNILETSIEGFIQVNNILVVEMVNDALCRMLGRTRDGVVGHSIYNLLPDDQKQKFSAQILLRERGERSTYEIDLLHDDGTRVNILVSASPLYDSQGRKIGSFALLSNISRMKETEEELRRSRKELEQRVQERTRELAETNTSLRTEIARHAHTEEALRESENRLQAILRGCPTPQFVIDRDHNVISWNKPLEEYSGIKAEDVMGTTGQWRAFYEDERPCLADLLMDYPSEKISLWYGNKCSPSRFLRDAYEGTDFFPTMAGGGRWLHFTAALIRDSQGTIIGAVETLEDITEQRRAQEEQLNLERQVQHAQKLESLGILAGGIAHDFNNLLVSIMGNADLALMDLEPDAAAREPVELVVATAQRAADLARQMLAYSGKGRFVIVPVDLSEVVREMAHLLEVSISKRVSLRYTLAPSLPATRVDVTQIRQIIMNLITNASEAIGDADGAITVATGVQPYAPAPPETIRIPEDLAADGSYVYVRVADTGAGMDAETIDRVFDPFFTTKFTGRGLGLSAVMGIVRGHNGFVEVHSKPGLGTVFKVFFPVSAQEAASGQQVTENIELGKGHGTILVVDDEAHIRNVTRILLGRYGFNVLTAEDGVEAVRVFREHQDEIVCVVLDLTMPHMDGGETLAELQSLCPGVRVLMSSGYHEQELVERFSERGLAGFIQKPYRLDDFVRAVHKAIARRSSSTAAS